jgi:hypothetical protein
MVLVPIDAMVYTDCQQKGDLHNCSDRLKLQKMEPHREEQVIH